MTNVIGSSLIVMESEKVMCPIIYFSKKKYIALEFKKPKYYYDDSWKDLENHIKEKLGVGELTDEMRDEYIKNTDEYTLLANGTKFDNLLKKGIDLVRRNSTLITRVILKKIFYSIFDYKKYGTYLHSLNFTTMQQYQNFLNGSDQEHDWAEYITKKEVEYFVEYLYSKELDSKLEFFELVARNKEDEK